MAMYRCANCGSPHVIKQEFDVQFSYKKALVGTAVFGAVGAVAGINGKRKYTYLCQDCGHQAALPMDDVTKNSIDRLVDVPSLLMMAHPELVTRYSYLKTELSKENSCTEAYVAEAQRYANPLNITEAEVRSAAKQWYDATRNLPFDPPAESTRKHLPVEQYINAFEQTRTIVYGLPAYSYLIMENDDTDSGLGRISLQTAALQYVLDMHGDMQLKELYDVITEHSVYSKTFELLKNKRTIKSGKFYRDWVNEYIPGPSVLLKDFVYGFRENEEVCRRFQISNGSVYAYGAFTPEQQMEADYPDFVKQQDDIRAEIKKTNNLISECVKKQEIPEVQNKKRKISYIKAQINTAELEIIALNKKIFGRAKAKQKAAELSEGIIQLKEEIAGIETEIKQREAAEIAHKQEKSKLLKEQLAKLEEEKELLEKQREVLLSSYSELICTCGPALQDVT